MNAKWFHYVMVLGVLVLAAPLTAQDVGKGNILFEYWYDIGGGTAVTDLTGNANYPDNPSESEWRTSFFTQPNLDNYGTRARAYIYPPQTGDYTFWISGDDGCSLRLSTDDNPANAVQIATVATWTDPRIWDKETNQKSAAVTLTQGQKYYIEALHKEGGGGDSLGVAWGGPGIGAGPVIIEGEYLAPFIRDPEPMLLAQSPTPADGDVFTTSLVWMQWVQGPTAVQHDVYFGTDEAAIEAAVVGSPEYIERKIKQAVFHLPPAVDPGTTYYWRIDEVEGDGTIRKGNVWSFTVAPYKAWRPSPSDGAKSVLPYSQLTWLPGLDASQHHLYISTDRALVEAGDESIKKDIAQWETSYPTTDLPPGTTYYWRVDAVSGTETTPGDVWSFTTMPPIAVVDPDLLAWFKMDEGTGITAIDYSGHDRHATFGDPAPTWAIGRFSGALEFAGNGDTAVHADGTFMNGLSAVTITAWIQSDTINTDRGFIIFETPVGNDDFDIRYDSAGATGGADDVLKMGVTVQTGPATTEIVQIETSANSQTTEWQHVAMVWASGQEMRVYLDGRLDVPTATEAPVTGTLTGFDTLILGQGGKDQTVDSSWDGLIDDVRIYGKALTAEEIVEIMLRGDPALAWDPNPANGAEVDIRDASALSWSAGDGAVAHDVYFAADRDAVIAAQTGSPAHRGQQPGTSFGLAGLVELGGGDYFWRIDEAAADGTIIRGSIWEFTVPNYLIVDTFEQYDEDYENLGCVYQTWIDGYGFTNPIDVPGNDSGAAVGHPTWDAASPHYGLTTVETTLTVAGSTQAMPLYYDNSGAGGKKRYSEATRTWTQPQDWTAGGVTHLSLRVRGDRDFDIPVTAVAPVIDGQVDALWANASVFPVDTTIAGTAPDNTADASGQFRLLYDSSNLYVLVEVNDVGPGQMDSTGFWDDDSIEFYVDGFNTKKQPPLEGFARQYTFGWHRPTEIAGTNMDVFGVEHAQMDTATGWRLEIKLPWLALRGEGTAPVGEVIGIDCFYNDDDDGGGRDSQMAWHSRIDNDWQTPASWGSARVGAAGAADQLYVVVQDASRSAVLPYGSADVFSTGAYVQWLIPLSDITAQGVNVTGVKKMSIRVGDPSAQTAGGKGVVYVDDIVILTPPPAGQ